MKKILMGFVLGVIACVLFIFLGGAKYLQKFGQKTEEAGVRLEVYEKKIKAKTKETLEETRETAKETVERTTDRVKETVDGAKEKVEGLIPGNAEEGKKGEDKGREKDKTAGK